MRQRGGFHIPLPSPPTWLTSTPGTVRAQAPRAQGSSSTGPILPGPDALSQWPVEKQPPHTLLSERTLQGTQRNRVYLKKRRVQVGPVHDDFYRLILESGCYTKALARLMTQDTSPVCKSTKFYMIQRKKLHYTFSFK